MKKRLIFLPLAVAVLLIGTNLAHAQEDNPVDAAFQQSESYSGLQQTGTDANGVPEYGYSTNANTNTTTNPPATTNTNTNSNVSNVQPTYSTGSAGPGTSVSSIQDFFNFIINFINQYLVPLIFAIAFIFFLYGVLTYFILSRGDEEKVKQGRDFIMWSVIAFVVMFSLWGIINLISGTISLNGKQPGYPQFTPQTTTNSTTGS